MSDLAIRLDNLGKMYRLYPRPVDKILDAFGLLRWCFWRRRAQQTFWALRGLNLRIRKGERVGIIGRNGAGKSTLLKLIAGNIAPTEGQVSVDGRVQALLELGTGFHPEFTGLQNIRASLDYQGLAAEVKRVYERDIIEFAELEDFIEQPIKTYSAGMYARLAFATATVIEPEILIIDEILGAGDAYFTGKCVERMRRLTEDSGATVFFVSHDLGSVQRLCERVIWIDRGRIRRDGDPLEVIKAYAAVVREEEEMRLKARDLKVLKQQAALLERHEDLYDNLLFHLVCTKESHPTHRHRMFGLRLLAGEEEVGRIDVGAPMDNAPDHIHYLMDMPDYMDWGPPQREGAGVYREYGDFQGAYAHAPFGFAVPKTLSAYGQAGDLWLEVEAECMADEVAVEVYAGEHYVRLGNLPVGPRRVTVFQLPQPADDDTAPAAPVTESKATPDAERAEAQEVGARASEYGSGEAQITAVHLLGPSGQECRIVEVGQPMRVEIEFEAYQELINPVFVFCVYLADGQCLTQWCVESEQLGHKSVHGKGRVAFRVDHLVMGRAACVGSAAIFKYLTPDGREADSYHVLDRCIHFQIVQAVEQELERGLCVQPFEADLSCGNPRLDA